MGVTSVVAVVAPRTGEIIKHGLRVFESGEIFAAKWYTTLCIQVKPIARNRVAKLEFTQGLGT